MASALVSSFYHRIAKEPNMPSDYFMPGIERTGSTALFDIYGQRDSSPILVWLPISFGLLTSAIVATVFCPVPRSQTVSGIGALFLAVRYVVVTVGSGTAVLAGGRRIVAGLRVELPNRMAFPLFYATTAWLAPTIAFYQRNSLWAVLASSVLSVLGFRLISEYRQANNAHPTSPLSDENEIAEFSQGRRLQIGALAALLLEVGLFLIVVSMARPAAFVMGNAVLIVSLLYERAVSIDQSPLRLRSAKVLRSVGTIGIAMILVVASLTPYLRFPGGTGMSSRNTEGIKQNALTKTTAESANPKPSFLQSANLFFRRLTDNDPTSAQDKHSGDVSINRPYPALQALFGDGEKKNKTRSLDKNLSKTAVTVLLSDDAAPGIILRPKMQDHVRIVPPLPVQRAFDDNPIEHKADPVSIPFYGAYWFYKTSDKVLPPDAVEVRGDPASTSLHATDFTPISMQAHQNFGSLIKLSCCRAIELVISNGDRIPGTVAVELILTNTKLPGHPHQSLGISSVNSTLRWFPGDNRPPVREVLTFQLPTQSAIQSFDEATVRFELRSPRERLSAKIAIEKFRLIPFGL